MQATDAMIAARFDSSPIVRKYLTVRAQHHLGELMRADWDVGDAAFASAVLVLAKRSTRPTVYEVGAAPAPPETWEGYRADNTDQAAHQRPRDGGSGDGESRRAA